MIGVVMGGANMIGMLRSKLVCAEAGAIGTPVIDQNNLPGPWELLEFFDNALEAVGEGGAFLIEGKNEGEVGHPADSVMEGTAPLLKK